MRPGLLIGHGMVFFLLSCGSGEEITTLSVEERFNIAKALYDEEDYLDAIDMFNVITLQHQGSTYADDAQFYLGEARYERREFLLAAFEYQQLKRSMPASPYIPQAQYKLALSYYNLAPKPPLDQEYTLRAIDEFQNLVEYHMGSELAPAAEEKIRELTTRLAKKEYDTAELYATMEYHRAAILYYDAVIEKYHDTEYAPLSYIGKARALLERNQLILARRTILRFLDVYPDSVLRRRAENLLEDVEDRL